MLKKILCSALFLSQILLSQNSFAGLIELEVDQSTYQVNDVITAKVVVSDFSETLAGAFTELMFDVNALSLIDWQFSNMFDDGFGSYQYADDSILGALFLEDYADISADIATLAAQQGNRFVFATVQFKVLAEGLLDLGLNNNQSGFLSMDNDYLATSVIGTSFTVGSSTAVPVPATFMLMLLGCVGFLTTRRS